MKNLNRTAVFIFVVFIINGCNPTDDQGIIHVKKWEICPFHLTNSRSPHKHCLWESLESRNSFAIFSSPFDSKTAQSVLLRGKFISPHDHSHLSVRINCRNHINDIFINGHPLRLQRNKQFINKYGPIILPIPDSFLKKNGNVIDIQTLLIRQFTAIPAHTTIIHENQQKKIFIVDIAVYILLPLAILIFNFSFFISAVIFFLWNREEKIFLISAFILFFYFLFISFLFIPEEIIGRAISSRIHLALFPIFALCLIFLIQSLYRIYLSHYNRVAVILAVGFSATLLFLNEQITELYSPYMFVIGIILFILFLLHMLYVLDRMKKDRFLFVSLLLFIIFACLLATTEMISHATEKQYVFLTTVCSAPISIILFVVLMGREIIRTKVETELLYHTLKDPNKNWKLVITESTEGKLDQVIEFINKNYTRNISREGLAGAVDISTDYMSRLFKKYTGKKINDYINTLRVKAAMEKLADGDQKIIDIAYSVGFESLSTFNRAFKNETGQTPTRFRNRL